MRKRGFTTPKQYVLGGFLVLISLIFSALLVLVIAIQPRLDMKAEAEQIARQQTAILSIRGFDIFHGKTTYYSVFGLDKAGHDIVVVIDKETKDSRVFRLSNGVNQKDLQRLAKNYGIQPVEKVTFGMVDNRPVWEIRSNHQYYQIDFKTGQLKEEMR